MGRISSPNSGTITASCTARGMPFASSLSCWASANIVSKNEAMSSAGRKNWIERASSLPSFQNRCGVFAGTLIVSTPTTESAPRQAGGDGSGFLTRDEVMTAREVAELLRMPTSTVYELARKGVLLPAGWAGRGGSYGRGWSSFSLLDGYRQS
jgi:hypothetical protein